MVSIGLSVTDQVLGLLVSGQKAGQQLVGYLIVVLAHSVSRLGGSFLLSARLHKTTHTLPAWSDQVETRVIIRQIFSMRYGGTDSPITSAMRAVPMGCPEISNRYLYLLIV